ncbi:MAG: PBP1A family penicillin-binding protein [Candidatus Binatia bacterium]
MIRRTLRFVFRVVFLTILVVVVLATAASFAVWRELTQDLPDASELLDYRPPTATRVYAADGTLIGEFYVERRYLIPMDQVPLEVRRAFLAAEDADFYQHRGIDLQGIARAVYMNVAKGEIVQGASTITQQVVKQLLLSPERSFERKAKEMILALEIEAKLTKDQIFYLYLNHIYFGSGTYGIAAASNGFFGVPPSELTLPQAALLAGLPQAPSRYDPRRHMDEAIARQHYVLERMRIAGFITQQQYDEAIATPIVLAPPPEAVMDPAASWYVDQVRRLLEEEFGDEYAALGLQVTTAVDLKMQRAAEEALQKALAPMQKRLGGKRGKKKGDDDTPDQSEFIEGALVAIDPENAQVKALVGGLDYQRSVFNRAVLARRQPGSSFKPFVYATAVDHGYTQDTVVLDAPISLPDGRGGSWTPKNFGNRYMGSVPLKVALTNSLNTVSVRLILDVGVDQLRDHLRAFGFPTDFPRNLSLALGSSEVTLLDMVRAYGVFATLGKRFDPVFVTSVTDPNGNPVEFPGLRARYENVLSPRTAWIVSDMMRSVVERGTATAAKKLGRPAAGKTGTTNDSKDAWFVGFTPDLVTGVWVGFDADRTLGKATGGKLAAPIWTDFMAQALEGRPVRDLPIPEGVDLPGRPTPTPPGASPGPGGSPGATRKPKPTPTPEALPYDPEEPDRKAPDDPDLVPDAPSQRPERSAEGVGEPAGEGF